MRQRWMAILQAGIACILGAGCLGEPATAVLSSDGELADFGSGDAADSDTGSVESAEENGESSTEEEPGIRPIAGLYGLVDGKVTSDPCSFDYYFEAYTGYSMLEIPGIVAQTASLELEDGYFLWQEADAELETRDAVECEYTADGFECSTQEASSFDWTYEIDFSGELVAEDELVGTAVVRYVDADGWSEDYLESSGVDLEDCTNEFDMEWVLID